MTDTWIGWAAPGHVIREIIPAITRSQIALVPPIEVVSEEELAAFLIWIETYCAEAYVIHAMPQVIDASNWRDGLPAGI